MVRQPPQDPLAHFKNCDCVYCSRPWMQEFVSEDTVGPSLLDAHVAYLRSLDPDNQTKKVRNHWASAGMDPCLRKQWLKYHEAEPTNDDWNPDVLTLGESIEEDLVEKYKLTGGFIRGQRYVEVADPRLRLKMTGKIDALIVEDGVVVPVEVKSNKDYGEDKHYDAWKKLLPKLEHIAQLTLYLKALRLSKGYIHYVNKNRSLSARYEVKFSERFYDEMVAAFKELEDALPGPEPAIPAGLKEDKFPCSWYSRDRKKEEAVGKCAFYDHCYLGKPTKLGIEQIRWG